MGGGLRGFIATGASLLQGKFQPTGGCPAFCGSPALGAIVGGLRGFIATGASLLQGDGLCIFVGAPPSGRFLVVCEAYRDGGVAPTGKIPAHRVMPCIL
ncbi:hypothetical protein B9Z48_14295 [Limnohabitans sp. WS1]|nr:hypothetical protein B9Z48_14295 [Limnohabitans sp. WS1]